MKALAIEAIHNADFAEGKNYMIGQASNGLWFQFNIDLDNTALDFFYPLINPPS